MGRRNLDKETLLFILENYDREFTYKLYDAILDVTTDKDTGEGDTRKTLCALAIIVSAFMAFCADNASEPGLTPEGYTESFFDVVDAFTNMGEEVKDIIKGAEEKGRK